MIVSAVFSPVVTAERIGAAGQAGVSYILGSTPGQVRDDMFRAAQSYGNRLSASATGVMAGNAAAGRNLGYQGAEIASVVLPATKGVQLVGAVGRLGPVGAITAENVARSQVHSGGAYGRLSSQAGVIERHHIPPNSIGFTTKYSGPAIQMDYADHMLTSSHARMGLEGVAYRSEIQGLLDSGNVRGALAQEIWDVRRAAVQGGGSANKYNGAVREMLHYSYGKGWIIK